MRRDATARLAHMSADEQVLLRPLVETSRGFKITAAVLGGITLWGAFAYYLQVRYGLGRTGLNRPEYWGIYIICFVFFIGISHAGTLISAILRVCKAEWRRSITRSAELITVLVIGFGAIQPVIDLGRPERMLNIFFHAQPLSPLLWDVTSIGLYFTACTVYLYVPLLPDLALIRDSGIKAPRLYGFLAAGYRDTPSQRARLERQPVVMRPPLAAVELRRHAHSVVRLIRCRDPRVDHRSPLLTLSRWPVGLLASFRVHRLPSLLGSVKSDASAAPAMANTAKIRNTIPKAITTLIASFLCGLT